MRKNCHTVRIRPALLMLWLTGLRATEVFAYMTAPNARVEMYDAIVAKFDNGSIATISGAGTQPPNDTKHELDIRSCRIVSC